MAAQADPKSFGRLQSTVELKVEGGAERRALNISPIKSAPRRRPGASDTDQVLLH